MTTNPVTNHAAPGASAGSGTSNAGSIDSMFLQLLITQLKHQDPTSPMDPSAFVQQLAQVTTLDQLTQINQLLQNVLGPASTTSTSSTGGQ